LLQIANGSFGFGKASNMQKISWNNDLAILAQNWINQCVFSHDKNKDRNFPKLKVGQNLGMFSTSKVERENIFETIINLWFEEHKYFPPSSISPYRPTNDPSDYFLKVSTDNNSFLPIIY
jgi:hypothetical protein